MAAIQAFMGVPSASGDQSAASRAGKQLGGGALDRRDEGGAPAGIVLQIELGLDQLQLHQHRRAVAAAHQVDAGVEQVLSSTAARIASAAARSSGAGSCGVMIAVDIRAGPGSRRAGAACGWRG